MKKLFWVLLSTMCLASACEWDEEEEVYNPETESDLPSYITGLASNNLYEQISVTPYAYEAVVNTPEDLLDKGVSLLVSTSPSAEGGQNISLNQSEVFISQLKPSTLYYYCAYVERIGMKGEIYTFITNDFQEIRMETRLENGMAICDVLTETQIIEKGFCYRPHNLYGHSDEILWKKVIPGNDFSFPVSEAVDGMEAYVLTDEGISFCSCSFNVPVSFEIEQYFKDDTFWLRYGVKGCVDNSRCHIYKSDDDDYWFYVNETEIPEMQIEGNGMSGCCDLLSFMNTNDYDKFKMKYEGDTQQFESSVFAANRAIESEEEFFCFVRKYDSRFWYKNGVVNLQTDITIPSDICLRIRLYGEHTVFEGNNHVIDGFCFFPLFDMDWRYKVRNLRMGTPNSVFEVKAGTDSHKPQTNDVPDCLIANGTQDLTYNGFENCSVEGTVIVHNNSHFTVAKDFTGVDNRATVHYVDQ